MGKVQTISATEFKTKCLEILDRISRRELERVVIIKRGQVVALLTRAGTEAAQVEPLQGFRRGAVLIPEESI
jgi:antitoxin (DNA-binding transcriptional repressor) of toxin-antitoxin stability system